MNRPLRGRKLGVANSVRTEPQKPAKAWDHQDELQPGVRVSIGIMGTDAAVSAIIIAADKFSIKYRAIGSDIDRIAFKHAIDILAFEAA